MAHRPGRRAGTLPAPLATSTHDVLARIRAFQEEIAPITDPDAPSTGAARADAPQLLTIKAVAARLAISPSEAHRLVQQGRIAGLRIGRLWRVREDVLARYIREQEAEAARERRRVG